VGRSSRGIIHWGCEGKMSVDVGAVKMGSRRIGGGGQRRIRGGEGAADLRCWARRLCGKVSFLV
jgi:hypothetical protein